MLANETLNKYEQLKIKYRVSTPLNNVYNFSKWKTACRLRRSAQLNLK